MGKKIIMMVVFSLACSWASPLRAENLGRSVLEGQLKGGVEEKVGFSAEQREKLKAMREEYRVEQKPVQEDIRVKREALAQEFDADKLDRKKIEKIINDINTLQGQLMVNNADHIIKMREMITPQQFRKLKELREDHRSKKGPKDRVEAKEKK